MFLGQHNCITWLFIAFGVLCLVPHSVQAEDVERESTVTSRPAQENNETESDDLDLGFALDDDELDDIDLLDIDIPMVVTASRREERLLDVPYAISVITADDIRFSGARSVPDALRLAAGMDVADLAYGVQAVSPRGFHGLVSNQALVLVDGRQIFDSFFGGTLWGAWPFMLEDIDRIEVIRGPGGLTWGPNAVNGVINIVTKDPLDQKGITSVSRGGSRGTIRQYLGWASGDKKFRIRVSGEYEGSDGFEKQRPSYFSVGDNYKIGKMSVYSVIEPDENNKFVLSGGSAVMNGGFATMPYSVLDPKRRAGTETNFFMARWDRKVDEFNDLSFTTYVNDAWTSTGLSSIDVRYQQIALQMQHVHHVSRRLLFTWGVDSRADLFDSTNAAPPTMTSSYLSSGIVGLYGQMDWKFAPKWALQAGARIDYDTYGGFEPSFRTALSYQFHDDHMVYGAISRAVNIEALGMRHINLPMVRGLGYFTCNSSVPSQTVMAYEIGYRGKILDNIDASAVAFWHQDSNVSGIKPELGPPGLIQFNVDSIGTSSRYGVELEAKYKVCKELQFLSNYTFMHENWQSKYPFTNNNFIYPPRHKFMVGAIYSPWEDLHLSSFLYWVDSTHGPDSVIPLAQYPLSSYCRLDVRAEYEFWEDKASIAFGIQNLTDANHYEGSDMLLNTMEVPRMYYGQLRIHIPQE